MAKKEEIPQETPQAEEKPRGRAAFLKMLQEENPDYNPADDDSFMDDVFNRYSQERGQYDQMRGANDKLSEMVASDPRLGMFLSNITDKENPKSIPYALSSIYGNILDLDDEGLQEYENGYKENLARASESNKAMEQAVKNFEESKNRIMQFATDNNLNEESVAQLEAALYDTADNLLEGVIPDWLIDTVHKGLNYEKDMQEASDTGFVEGKNEAVDARLKKKVKSDEMPDLNNGTGAGINRQAPKPRGQKKNFFDALKADENNI